VNAKIADMQKELLWKKDRNSAADNSVVVAAGM